MMTEKNNIGQLAELFGLSEEEFANDFGNNIEGGVVRDVTSKRRKLFELFAFMLLFPVAFIAHSFW